MSKKKKTTKTKSKTKRLDKRTRTIIQTSLLPMAYDLPVRHEWLDDDEIAKIDNDATVLSATSIRKSTTLKKELIITASDAHVAEELTRRLDYDFRSRVLDTVMQGFGVFELNWYAEGYWYFPRPVERDYRLFELRGGDLHYLHDPVDPLKAIHTTYRAKFNAPMGRPLYATLFWLRRFKAASLEFWVEFLERFGKPWVVGKTDGDKDTMADELYAMLGGDVAVVEGEDTVEFKTPADKGGFQPIVTYLDDQIREAIVGGNLTGNVTGGSFAAAKVHKEVSDDIAMTDGWILHEAVSAILDRFRRLNHYTGTLEFEIKDQDDPRLQLAERDAHLVQAFGGAYRFSQDYFRDTYKIDLETAPTPPIPARRTLYPANHQPSTNNHPPTTIHHPSPLPADEIERITRDWAHSDAPDDLSEQIAQMLEQILAKASTYEEAFEQLQTAFHTLDESRLREAFADHITLATLYGAAESELESEA